MTQLKHKGDLFSVKVRKNKDGTKKKGKKNLEGKGKETNKKTYRDHQPSIDVQPLTYKTLVVGQVLLGCVSEVREYELLVSLPHNLVGTVSLAHISRSYTTLLSKLENEDEDDEDIHALEDLYHCGQYVVASIVSIEKIENKTKVELTLMPNEVNFGISAASLETGLVLPCAVMSVEDKGYAVDVGISGVSGAFLRKDKTDESMTIGVGSVLRCLITKIIGREGNLHLKLSADPKAVSSATLKLSSTANVSLLLPGTAVKTTISRIHSDSLKLMLADLDGVVHPIHLSHCFDVIGDYSLGDTVMARVLYVTPLSKVVHLTLQKDVCCKKPPTNPSEELRTGDIIREAEIYKTSSGGIYLRLNSNTRGFCSGNHITDKSKILKHIKRDYPVGKKVTCRLLHYSSLDQLFIVSLEKSILEQQFVNYAEMEAGQIVEATVNEHSSTGAFLAVSKMITGFVPPLHLPATPLKQIKRKNAESQHVVARVIKVNPQKRQLHLTLNKVLVNAKEPILTEYSEEAVDMVTVGYVIKILPAGLLIGMFNDVKGFAPKSQVGVRSTENLSAMFQEGQAVQCKVLNVYPDRKSIILSLRVDGAAPVNKKTSNLMDNVKMRARVKCRVDKVEADAIKVTIVPENVQAVIPISHLSDYESKCQLLKELISEEDEITNAVVCSKGVGSITLTLKSSVSFWIDHSDSEVMEGQELVPQESYPGTVSDVKSFGLLVTIPSGDIGNRVLLHIKNMTFPGKRVSANEWKLGVGHSLYITFKDRDEKGRPVFTSSVKDNLKNATQSSLQLLYSYLKNEEIIATGLSNRGGDDAQLAKFGIGDKVLAVVTKVTPQEVLVKLQKKNITGTIARSHHGKAQFQVGQKVKASVLYVNQEDKSLDLTLKPNLMLNIHSNKNEKLHSGMKVKCEVVLVKKYFTMVIMKSECVGTVAYLPNLIHLNVFSDGSPTNIGHKCWVVVKHVEGPLVLGVLKCNEKGQKLNLISKLPTVRFASRGEGDDEVSEEATDGDEEGEETKPQEEQGIKEELADDIGGVEVKEEQKVSKKRKSENKPEKKSKKIKAEEESKDNSSDQPITNAKQQTNKKSKVKEEEVEDEKNKEDAPKPCLSVKTGFVWDVPDTTESATLDDSSESEDEELSKKKAKQLKRSDRIAEAREEEQRLHQLEMAKLDKHQTPKSALEFETMLQTSPNSSAVWIQFVSFLLESAEVEKAKGVARRALQVINIEEEEERLNIWTVLFRLEVLYGTPDSVTEVYKEALATTDPLKIHFAAAMVYTETIKLKEAEKVYYNISKKFSQNFNVWVKAGIFFFSHNMAKEGRHYLDRALHSLEKKDHVELISRFGQLEFRFGEAERGRTMFESLLSTYWKRLDIWAVYVDILTKRKDIEGARTVLERMTNLKLRLRKMRIVFKKFLEFEKEHGNAQSVEAVKQRVQEFVVATLH